MEGVVDVDPLTGTPRVVARLDGFLTGPSRRDAKKIALDYVRAHPEVFKLDADDIAGLRLTRDYVDVRGTNHLVWAQTYRGIPSFDNDVRANVASDGRLINVVGSPLPDLRSATTAPAIDASHAVAATLRSVGRTTARGGHRANLVLFNDGREVRLAWRTTAVVDADEIYDGVVDASTGQVLRRSNKVADASGNVWDYYPGAPRGGTAASVDFTARGWLSSSATRLDGAFARVFIDFNDNDVADSGEEVLPLAYGFSTFSDPRSLCSPSTCSWNSYLTGSWRTNRKQNATQVFYYVNNFHDWLLGNDVGFDALSGNFQGSDRVRAHADDGAATGGFLGPDMPNADHVNNANMFTPPDGSFPTMQMYLFTSFTGDPATDPTPDVNGGDDASIVYHEYTHGLSNRLITYSDGWGALDAFQSGAMGEAWSDWYAMDYLASNGSPTPFVDDTATPGEVVIGSYADNASRLLRTEGLDCAAGVASAGCPGTFGAGGGGYTYRDMSRVCLCGPEVHADGEIWGQTLWDLRAAVGSATARMLITDAMRISPLNPSFLDMRDAILLADVDDFGGANHDTIWDVFRNRGMGFFAVTGGANDVEPIENFDPPPADESVVGDLTGRVLDKETDKPLAGALVLAGNFSDTTDALGRFSIPNIPVATYGSVVGTKKGYDDAVASDVPVATGPNELVAPLELHRDWASFEGGGRVSKASPPSFAAFGCGPTQGIDHVLATGWSSTSTTHPDFPGAKSITVKLPAYVDMTGFAIDPNAACGDDPAAALQTYKLYFSKNGTTFSLITAGAFPADGSANGHLNELTLLSPRKAVRYVRLTMLSNQGDASFMDMSELEVYGTPTPTCLGLPATKVGTNAGQTINGTAGADVIVGLGGNDRIDGRRGRDAICGGDGADTLIGGPGVDKFDAGNQNDTIFSRDRNKELTIRGGTGTDRARKDKSDRTRSVERFF